MLASRLLFLMVFGSASGCLGLENQEFGKACIAKTRNSKTYDSGVHFSRSWVALVTISMNFVAMETGLEFDDFSK